VAVAADDKYQCEAQAVVPLCGHLEKAVSNGAGDNPRSRFQIPPCLARRGSSPLGKVLAKRPRCLVLGCTNRTQLLGRHRMQQHPQTKQYMEFDDLEEYDTVSVGAVYCWPPFGGPELTM
jgi:hypothetical protein